MSKFYRAGDFVFNFDNINYVQKMEHPEGDVYLHVYFVGEEKEVEFNIEEPDGKALLHWFENSVQSLPDGTEKATTMKTNWN